jgi:hypothetical protein
MALQSFIMTLDRWGVATVLLPFILVFTIVFAVLQKSEVLGAGKKNFNVMVALAMALAVIFPHVLGTYPPSADPVLIINNALPAVSVVMVAIIMFLLLIGIMGGQVKWLGSSISGWIAIFSLLVIIYIFGRATGWPGFTSEMPRWLRWVDNPDVLAFIIIILVFGVLIWYITKDDSASTKGNILTSTMENFGKLFGGGKN